MPEETVPARRKADSHWRNQRTGSASQKAGRSSLETAAMSALLLPEFLLRQRRRVFACLFLSLLQARLVLSLLAGPSALLVKTSWPGTKRENTIYKKKIRNQSTTGGVGAKEFLTVLLIRNSYCIYTVLRLILKQKHGLEFEREYSAVHEDYMSVCILFVHGTSRIRTQCTVYVAWSWCGNYAANAVEYSSEIYGILYLENDTILHLRIRLRRISRL
jgi:hypothetical protein